MGILKHKKAEMPAARLLTLILFLFRTVMVLGQVIDGEYSTSRLGDEIYYTMKFHDGRFHEVSLQHLGGKEISSGYYWVLKDTLFQWYEKFTMPPNFVVEKKEKQNDILGNRIIGTNISLYFNGNEGHKYPINIMLLSKDKKILKGLVPDSLGYVSINLSWDSEVDKIICSSFTDECEINIYDFLGYSVKIQVTLTSRGVRQSQYTGLRKLLIKQFTKRSISLLDLSSSNVYIYHKDK